MAFRKHSCFYGPSRIQGKEFLHGRKIGHSSISKPENRFMYILFTSAHSRHTIKNYVIGELKRYN